MAWKKWCWVVVPAVLGSQGALAAPPGPSVQEVQVVNPSLPVTLDQEVDVFVTNPSLDVAVQGPIELSGPIDLSGPIEVTGLLGGPIEARATESAVFGAVQESGFGFLTSTGASACFTVPATKRLVVQTVSARLVSGPDEVWGIAATSRINSGPTASYFLEMTRTQAIGGDFWVMSEQVSLYADPITDFCLRAQPLAGVATIAQWSWAFSGYLVDMP